MTEDERVRVQPTSSGPRSSSPTEKVEDYLQ